MKSFKLHLLLILLPLLGISQTDVSVESILVSPFAPYSYGNNVNFQITVRNNGPLAVKNITIEDVIPCGLNFTGGSQTWNSSGANRITTISSTLNPGQSASVSISFDIVPCLLNSAWQNTAMIVAYEDINDINIFNADTNSGNNSLSEELPIFDLALRKTLASPSPYDYGDTLTFNIEVHNQGNQPISGFLINDYLPAGVGYYFDASLNPMWSGGPAVYNRWVNMSPALNPGSVETISIDLVLLRTSGGNRAWVNYAEIASASDVSSNPIFDADSFYGSNSIQENNVLPGTLNDDNLNSTGIGNNDDDDDHDPAGAEIFDLALTKIQGSALLSFSYLQDVEYVFTIYNQGSVPATNIEITDYLSPALQYMNSPKNLLRGWNYNNILHTAKRTYTNVLLPGQSDTLKLDLMPVQFYVNPDNAWTDFAEISDADDNDPNTALKPVDIDSTPDSINGNDAGGKPNYPSDNFINGDGSGLPDSPIAAEDEDDHDPHKIQIFDLALRKTKITPGSFFQIGEDVVFQITVYNQGNVPAKNIVISDYVPSGFDFIAGGPNTGWIGTEPLVKYTYAPVLLPGANTSFQITLRVQNSALPNAYLNYAEVSAAMDTLNNNRNDDADSVIDDDPNNDNLAIPGSPEDDNIIGNSFIGGDQDDHDVSGIGLLCQQPTLTFGIPECDPGNGTYSVTYYSNVANITNSAGTLTSSKITGINLGTNVTVTAANGMNCSISLTVFSPASCPGTGGCSYPKLTVGQPLCNGTTYSVSYSTDLGVVTATTGTVNATTISNIPIGTNITVSATNGSCVSDINVSSPTNCDVPCANSPITISGPVCETNGAGTYKINYTVEAGTNVVASTGTLTAGMVTDIPSGVDLTLTVTRPGCDTRVIVVPAGDCPVCQRPTLTVGKPECDPGNGTYSVTYYSNVVNITNSAGTIAGSKITGINLGTNVSITASNGVNCSVSLTVVSPASCPGTGGCTYPQLTVGQPICTGGGFWSVSYSKDTGIIGTTGGAAGANSITNIPIGTNITVSASNGFCISRVQVSSPTNCGVPCANSPITISGPVCETNGAGTYKINYTVEAGTNVVASTGTLTAGMVTDIPSGVDLTLTVTRPGCDTRVIVVPAGNCPVCQQPTLTVGIPECDPGNGTYSVTYYSNVANITNSVGTLTGSKITGINIGTNVSITASNGMNCSVSLTVLSPASCPGTGGCTYPELTVGQPLCNGSTYSVSFSTDMGVVTSTTGTVNASTISNIPIGTNITVSATNGSCVSEVNISSPTNCGVPCANSPITISGPVCETNGAGTYKINYTVEAGTNVVASTGTLTAGMVTDIPSGVDLTLTVTRPGCDTRIIVVPAGDCPVCQQPTLTVGIPECDPGNGTYSVTYYSNVANIINSAGTIAGSKITGINLGTNVSITASNGMNCSVSMTVISPASCPGTGGCTYPKLTVGQPYCNGSTYSVSYSTDMGVVTSTTGTVNAGTISDIPIGTNITVSATSGSCVSDINVSSPTNCGVPCANSPITISGPVCETNGAGTYKINFIVEPGTTVVASTGTLTAGMVTDIPSGVDLTLTVTTPGCDTRVIVVPAGECNLGNASVGSFVWHDINGDGLQSPGEPGIPGVHVVLFDALSNIIAQTSTGANGQYLFTEVIPGDYFIRFNPPSNFEITFINIGDDNLDSDVGIFYGPGTTETFTLLPGEINNSIDAGLYRCIPIGDLVWYDSNKNDIYNITENGINGLRVNLWRNNFGVWQVWAYKYTGPKPGSPSDDGYFEFCAPPGTYFVEVIMPPLGLVRARQDIGNNEEVDSDINTDGQTNNFTVTSGQSKSDLGAGFYPMATAGNLVWRDDNLNGIQDVGEAKVQGVVVEAIELNTGNVSASAVTDSEGIYTLDYLEKQLYYLKFTPPAEYTATIPGAAADNMDSDVDHSFGINTTRAFSMEPSNENNNIDMGIAFGVLPVEWLNIFAKKSENGNFVSWTVGREWNVSHYIIERKAKGDQQFFELPEKITVKDNKFGYSEYTFNDRDKLDSGICYYRVKQVDFDGKFSYSEIVYVNGLNSFSVNLYPNPAKSLTNLEILQDKDGEIEVDLLDSNGKFVKRILTEHAVKQGENLIPIQLQEIPRGLYMIRIYDGSGLVIDRKLLLTD